VYVGDYEIGSHVHMHSERLLSREEFVAEALGVEATHKTIVTPDAVLAEAVRAAGIQAELIEYPNAGVIARLGWERLQRGQTVRPEELEANYIRHSDAEIFSKPTVVRLSMPVAIRSAALNDVLAILAIEQQAPGAAHWTAEQYKKLVGTGVVLVAEEVAEEAGKLCGFVCAKALAGEWEIENVVVASEFLRRGIANELVCELIQRAVGEAASAILLEVRESNLPARRLYEKHGFREVGRRRVYYRDPVEDAILYALRFAR
jgi:ribosomal-protein-alanine N-acetyltransferase